MFQFLAVAVVLALLLIKPTTSNTIKNKKLAYNVLAKHSEIPGFTILASWLSVDNFLTNDPYIAPENLPATIEIGRGKGATEITNIDEFLRDLTAEKLNKITYKALRYEPKADTPDIREEIIMWITADIPNIHNYDQLVKDLTALNWITMNPQIPPNYKLDTSLNFSANGKTRRILNYPNFVLTASANDILEMTNALLDPKDSTLEDRQYTFLQVNTSVIGGIPGFLEFRNMLTVNGFIKSPQQFNVPDLLPNPLVLGGLSLTAKDLTALFKNGSNADISATITEALNTYDPSLPQRIASLATMKSVMNNFPGEPGFPGNMETVYNWLCQSGFATKNRKFTPIKNPPSDFVVISYGWYLISGNVNDWLQRVDYNHVDALNVYATKGSFYEHKYRAYKNCMIYGFTGDQNYSSLAELYEWAYQPGNSTNPTEFSNHFISLYGQGLMFDPPTLPTISQVQMGLGDPKHYFTNERLNNEPMLLIQMWLGADAGIYPNGILVQTLTNGTANPQYNPASNVLAIAVEQNLNYNGVFLTP